VPFDRAVHAVRLEVAYEWRWLFRREAVFEDDKNGKLTVREIARGSRDYVNAKVAVDFTKLFGVDVAYESGQLPPAYKSVNRKVTVGLTFKAKRAGAGE
jgi:hypothetical protein